MSDAPLGVELPDWTTAAAPAARALEGAYVLLRPPDPEHDAAPLYAASHPPEGDTDTWTYLPDGPYADIEAMRAMLARARGSADPLFFVIAPLPERVPRGMCSYLRIEPQHGVIEIGHIWFGVGLARTRAATEAIFLLLRHAFDELHYRRVEWKCNALNAASRRAAERFGFAFEGVFRNHQVIKGRNRDTAWYSIVDSEWPAIRAAFTAWLDPDNFDRNGRQRSALSDLMRRGPVSGLGRSHGT